MMSMRETSQDLHINTTNSGKLAGIALGYDFCAEHEWGNKEVREAFGINPDAKPGIDRMKIMQCPEQLQFRTKGKKTMLIFTLRNRPCMFDTKNRWDIEDDENFDSVWDMYYRAHRAQKKDWNPDPWKWQSAWGEPGFLIMTEDKVIKRRLTELHDAFHNLDVAFGFKRDVWTGQGLFLGIVSAIPKEDLDELKAAHESHDRLLKAVEATGIEERLRAAGLRWMSLRPQWKDETETEIMWWLNPWDQQKHAYGWMTLKDLEDWAKGVGKVMEVERV